MENQVKNQMNKNLKIWLVLVILAVIAVAILAAIWAATTIYGSRFPYRRLPPSEFIPGDIELFYIARTVVSTVNIALLMILIATYVSIYL